MDSSLQGSGIPLERFASVVDLIYDCALDPRLWQRAILDIADVCRSTVCIIGVHDYRSSRSELTYQHGYDDYYVRLHEEKFRTLDPFFVAARSRQEGEVVTRAMLIDDEEFFATRFYQEWVRPQGLGDMMTVKLLATDQRVGWMTHNRSATMPRYDDTSVRVFGLLAQHICRALKISDALNLETIRSEAMESALNALASGVYLVDSLGHVVFMNRAAERQIEAGNTLRVESNQLRAADPAVRKELSRSISEAVADETVPSTGGVSIALPGPGRGLVATVLPLTRGQRRNVCGAFAAMAAIFVQDPVVVPPFPGDAFAKLYGLTGGELRVLLALAAGLGVKEAAEVLGISEATAKTHLQHIYAKTGASKQTELMQLFARSAPPVAEG